MNSTQPPIYSLRDNLSQNNYAKQPFYNNRNVTQPQHNLSPSVSSSNSHLSRYNIFDPNRSGNLQYSPQNTINENIRNNSHINIGRSSFHTNYYENIASPNYEGIISSLNRGNVQTKAVSMNNNETRVDSTGNYQIVVLVLDVLIFCDIHQA